MGLFIQKYKSFFLFIILVSLSVLFLVKTAYHLPTTFEPEPGGGAFGGIRLHYLKILNFNFSEGVSAVGGTSHLLDNFWKSSAYSFHGLLSYLHWYVYVGVLDLFDAPITESNLLFCQAVLVTLAVFIFSLSLKLIFGSGVLAIVFLLMAFPLLSQYGRTFYVMAPHLFYLSLFFYSVGLYFCKKKSFLLKIGIGLSLLLNMASGNLILLPVLLLFVWCVAYHKEQIGLLSFIKKGLFDKPSHFLFFIPIIVPIFLHFYVHSRVGVSNLGLLGWGFLKLGLGHQWSLEKNSWFDFASKFSQLKTYFDIYVTNDVFHFWGSLILLGGYFGGFFRKFSSLPIKLFAVIYFIYVCGIQKNLSVFPLLLILSLGTTEIILLIRSGLKNRSFLYRSASMALVVILIVANWGAPGIRSTLKAFQRPPSSPNDLKAAGYLLREHMKKEDKIASFLSNTDNILNEFYYGKTFFKSPVFGKEIYSLANVREATSPVTPEEVDREFAFYVIEKGFFKDRGQSEFMNGLISKYRLKKIADIGAKFEIYSSRSVPFQYIDIQEANRLFDKKYANLKNLFYHHHVGVASTWGFY